MADFAIPKPTNFIVRDDIEWSRYPHEKRWVAKDPLTNHFFYFNELEFKVVQLLHDTDDLEAIYKTINAGQTVPSHSQAWLSSFVRRLAAAHIVLTPRAPLYLKRSPANWLLFLKPLLSPLSLKVPLYRPGDSGLTFRLLALLCFHPWTAIGLAIMFPVACLLVLVEFLANINRAFVNYEILRGDRAILLFLMYALIKSLHEFGHYLACVRWKTQCPEVGLLFLFFTPCFYCDTTDSWKLPSRWQRASIAAAGIYVELWIATLAGLVFAFTSNDLTRNFAGVAFCICTLGTILINGNPLFRYDGYYIVGDLWRVPNLALQGQNAIWQGFVWILGGRRPNPSDFDKPIWQLCLFACLAAAYRWFVTLGILMLAWTWLVPRGLGFLALLIMCVKFLEVILSSRRFIHGMLIEFFTRKPIRLLRVVAFWSLLAVAGYAGFHFPLPHRVQSRGFLDLGNKQPVYVMHSSTLLRMGKDTNRNQSHELLFETFSYEKEWELLALRHEIIERKTQIQLLEDSKLADPSVVYEIPTAVELLSELEAKRSLLEAELASLSHSTDRKGIFVPAMLTNSLSTVPQIAEDRYLSSQAIGRGVERGSMAGWFGSEDELQPIALVPEKDARWIYVGMHADLVLDSSPARRYACTVQSVSAEPVSDFPRELLADDLLFPIRDAAGKLRFETHHYQVVLKLDEQLPDALFGSRATLDFPLKPKAIYRMVMDALRDGFSIHNRI